MNSVGYRITTRATRDLEEIWQYTSEQWSIEQADLYYRLITNEFEALVKNPLLGKNASHIRQGYRCRVIKSHIIYYRVEELEKTEIEIVRILHHRMNVPDWL